MLLSRRGCVKVASRGCRFAFVQARSRFLSTYWFLSRYWGSSSSFLWRLRSGFDGVWLFRIHCPEAAVLPLSKLGCALVCVYVLELFFLSFKGFQSLSSDLAGVWPFRIHCPEAPVLRLSRLCCVTFFVYVLGLSSSPSRVPKVPLRQLVNDRFLPCLSSDLGGVWPFRTHCPEAPVLRLSRLGCVTFFVYVLGLSSSPLRVQRLPLCFPIDQISQFGGIVNSEK